MKKMTWKMIPFVLVSMAMGAGIGYMAGYYFGTIWSSEMSPGWKMIRTGIVILVLAAAVYLQTIIHEAGHLVAGLLTGYQFSSFRIASLMLQKTEDGLKMKRYSLAGTGGQCLLIPPEHGAEDENVPFVLYHLGGVLMNLLTVPVFAAGYYLLGRDGIPAMTCLFLALAGAVFAVTNGVPMSGTVSNDGSNVIQMLRNPKARHAFFVQMRIYDGVSRGIRLRDMPTSYFYIPKEKDLGSTLVASAAVFYENRLMDEHRFEEAAEYIDFLLEKASGLLGIYRSLLTCDRIYCELIGKSDKEAVDKMLTRDQRKFMKQMKTNPAILRTEYVCALLYSCDKEKAEKIRKEFERYTRSYPHPEEVKGERELMDIADENNRHIDGRNHSFDRPVW